MPRVDTTSAAASAVTTHARIYAAVARIPRGRVATYGQIAELAGLPAQARLVGYALHALPEKSAVPWHRVVNARGAVSPRTSGSGHDSLQVVMLRSEGVRFSPRGIIALGVYQWRPRLRAAGRNP